MGRKQLPLISTHFQRHEKLTDNSNRYRHTCRACGEEFPKGRNEVLMAHLARNCPDVPAADRQMALDHLAGNDAARATKDASSPHALDQDLVALQANLMQHVGNHDASSNTFGVGLPAGMVPNSRAGLDILSDVAAREGGRAGQAVAEQAPMFRVGSPSSQLRQQLDFDDRNNLFAPQNGGSELLANVSMTGDQAVPGLSLPYHSQRSLPMLSELSNRNPHGPYYAGASAGLTMTARAASELKPLYSPKSEAHALVPSQIPAQAGATSDGQMSSFQSPPTPGLAPGSGDAPMTTVLGSSFDKLPATEIDRIIRDSMHRHIPPSPGMPSTPSTITFIEGNGDDSATMSATGGRHQRKRGRFSEPRRKEVQEVRKLGACLRCRILRKPCSGTETPCTTCKSIESARSWTIPCTRTRLADQMETYSSGLQGAILEQMMAGLQTDLSAISATQSLEASLLITNAPDEMLTIRIPAVAKTTALFGEAGTDPGQQLSILDSTVDQLSETLSSSLLTANPMLISGHNMFMTATLQLSMDRVRNGNVKILRNAHELYWATNVLCSGEQAWDLYKGEVNTVGEPRSSIDRNSLSYAAVERQLNAAVASRAAKVAADVAADFERRVIGRSTTSWQETYLAAIILLRCLEKMVWLFSVYEQGQGPVGWLVEKPPSYYIDSSFQFTELVMRSAMMRGVGTRLKVRHPRPGVQADGTSSSGVAMLTSDAEEDEMRNWFDSFGFTSAQLADLKIPTEPSQKVDPAHWEMRFVARLLLASIQS